MLPALFTGTVYGGFAALVTCAYYVGLFGALALDWRRTPAIDSFQIRREAPDRVSSRAECQVTLRVRNASAAAATLTLVDSVPASLRPLPQAEALSQECGRVSIAMGAAERRSVQYPVYPFRRGDGVFGDIHLTVHGSMGLLEKRGHLRASDGSTALIRVYPQIQDAERFELMARKGKLRQVGLRRVRSQGVGRDFESLRDYLPDDEMRSIDWKATARRGKLVSRQFEVEKSQAIIIVLDIGRTMLSELNGIPKMDYAIDAALLLSHVAVLADDMVGLLVFSDTVHTYLPPHRGRAQMHAIVESVYKLQASLVESDYEGAISFLRSRWRKRALTVCFTDLWDPDSARQTVQVLSMLQPSHLVAAVTLLDPAVKAATELPSESTLKVLQKAVALQMQEDRKQAQDALTDRGVLVVDSPADSVSVDLVNRYLQVKERAML